MVGCRKERRTKKEGKGREKKERIREKKGKIREIKRRGGQRKGKGREKKDQRKEGKDQRGCTSNNNVHYSIYNSRDKLLVLISAHCIMSYHMHSQSFSSLLWRLLTSS